MSTLFKLTDKDGTLYLDDVMVLYTYPGGDCDRLVWPATDDTPEELSAWRGKLAQCLFDMREMGYWDGNCIELPDGGEFYPDDHLEEYTPISAEGWPY